MTITITQVPWLDELTQKRTPPCVSIYQPLHRAAPPAHENPVRFRNLLRQAEQSMLRGYSAVESRRIIDQIHSRVDRPEFWTGPRDGMAVFAAPDYLRIIETQQPTVELAIVADGFHIKPLIRLMQGADRYHILCFTQGRVRLFDGSRIGVREIELVNTPRSVYELSGMTHDRQVSSARDVETSPQQAADEAQSIPRPSGLDHFIRAVDKGIWENHSRPLRLPLILFADGQYHPMWRNIARNPMLLDEGVTLDPHNLDNDRIRQEAWKVYEPIYLQRIEHLAGKFQAARAHDMGSERLDHVAQAAVAGRVGSLMLADNAHIPGRLDPASGKIQKAELADPKVDDVLDDLAELVLKMDGQVVAVPPDLMPDHAGLAAIYRY